MGFIRALFLTTCLATSLSAQASEKSPSLELGNTPTEITMEVEIDVTIDAAWAAFATIGDIYLNSPTVSKSFLSSDNAEGIGASRHMEMAFKKGATLDERVIEWKDGSYMALEVYKIQGVSGVQTMGGDFLFTERDGKTLVTSTLNYSMTNPFFGLMNRMMMKNKFADLWASVLSGYKKHLETEVEVTENTELDLDAVTLLEIEISS